MYYHLAHNYWDSESKQSVVRVIHNFGRADELDREHLVRLCRSIARICELEVTDKLQRSELAPTESLDDLKSLPETLELVRTMELGTLVAIEAFWEQLGIGKSLREISHKANSQIPAERALLAMTANRLCEPESKLGVWERWLETVYLPSCDGLKLRQMYEAMDLLQKHSEQVEEAIFFQTASLLDSVVHNLRWR